ncbi:ribosomal RNA small subunit methyltransferase mra1-like [Vicia villosa]|uniref:ribosomal RNA small subunit methyltransferase mra1-like n=1 Tax=Vicia villosa TaxID=3911 RepID=UPI00273B0926|nr:ribosomal RNA small subunit methyltransferase mra1-like [Vicia villosa]
MTRAYTMKGKKRKNKEVLTKYDREEKEEEQIQQKKPAIQNEEPTPIVAKTEENSELAGIPITPSVEKNSQEPGVIFVLEKASSKVAKVGKLCLHTYQLLNSDGHANFLQKNNKNPGNYRPDICHQALLSILDSPLNKAGRLKALYVRTEKGVLIEVKNYVRIPRTFKRLAGVMLELLQKLSISAVGEREKLIVEHMELLFSNRYIPMHLGKFYGFNKSKNCGHIELDLRYEGSSFWLYECNEHVEQCLKTKG